MRKFQQEFSLLAFSEKRTRWYYIYHNIWLIYIIQRMLFFVRQSQATKNKCILFKNCCAVCVLHVYDTRFAQQFVQFAYCIVQFAYCTIVQYPVSSSSGFVRDIYIETTSLGIWLIIPSSWKILTVLILFLLGNIKAHTHVAEKYFYPSPPSNTNKHQQNSSTSLIQVSFLFTYPSSHFINIE